MATFIENAPEQVLAAAKELLEKGLVEGTSGNISARQEDGNIAVTPSSLDYRIMQLEDIVVVNPAGEVVSGESAPTSEKYLHLACLAAYEDIAVVIHSHAVHATMFAVAQQDIPSCIDEFTVYLGGDIRCTQYAPSGSPDLGEQTVKALEDRRAALIANQRDGGRRHDPWKRPCTTPRWSSAAPKSFGAPSNSAPSTRCPRRSTSSLPASTRTCANA